MSDDGFGKLSPAGMTPQPLLTTTELSFEEAAGPVSRFFLTYLDPLFAKGAGGGLVHEDLGLCSKQDKALELHTRFTREWDVERKKPRKKQSLWFVLWRVVGYPRIFLAIGLYAVFAAVSFGPILILTQLTSHFEGKTILTTAQLWILVAFMFIFPALATFFVAQSNVILAHIGMQFRNVLVDMIYRKSLRLAPSSRQTTSTGQIINMFSNDTGQLQRFLFFCNNVALAPAQIAVAIALIYQQVGPSVFVGVGLMFVLTPVNVFIFQFLTSLRKEKVKVTDSRVKLMNEVLSGIRIIKYYAWEEAFELKIGAIRAVELKILRDLAYIVAIGFTLVLMAVPIVQPVIVFYTFVRLGGRLDASTAFTTISLFNLLQFPFAFLPMGLAQYSQSLVSCNRMLDFFASDELAPYVITDAPSPADQTQTQAQAQTQSKQPHLMAPVDNGSGKLQEVAVRLSGASLCWVDETKENQRLAEKAVAEAKAAKKKGTAPATSAAPATATATAIPSSAIELVSVGKSTRTSHKENGISVSGSGSGSVSGSGDTTATATVTASAGVPYQALPKSEEEGEGLGGGGTVASRGADGADGAAVVLAVEGEDHTPTPTPTTTSPSPSPSPSPSLNRSFNTLLNINITVPTGSLVAVVGPVGCGKSSLLAALLGEMNLQEGAVGVVGSVAYCDQRPWVLNTTVRENILFGQPYDEARFDRAVHVANLEEDIRVLPGGILTEIGEKGINLSGGQKARVALARAVYRNADVYLLDDPLSAVDAHVGLHLFEECILKQLRGKTRVLVTHQVHLLGRCDLIVVMEDGRVKAQGTLAELKRQGVELEGATDNSKTGLTPFSSADNLASLVDGEGLGVSTSKGKGTGKDNGVEQMGKTSEGLGDPTSHGTVSTDKGDQQQQPQRMRSASASASTSAAASDKQKTAADARHKDTRSSNLTTTEERNLGDVALSTYMHYIKAGGIAFFSIGMLFQVFAQVFQNVGAFWLSWWGAATIADSLSGNPMSTPQSVFYLNYYAMFLLLSLACIFLRALVMANHRLGTSTTLHRNVLRRVMAAPVSFFDVTPLGRILNRFSSDMNVIDEDLQQTISQVTNSFFQTLGALGAVAGATKGTFLLLMVPLIIIYQRVQRYFRNTNTTVARLEAVSRSPIYADFSQALAGVSSIRAYREESKFVSNLERVLDRNSIAGITAQLAGQWLAIRLDLLGAVISFFVAVLAVGTASTDFIPAGFMALGLSYSFQITTYLKFCVRILATGEAQMNSVERVLYYTDSIEQERSVVSGSGSGAGAGAGSTPKTPTSASSTTTVTTTPSAETAATLSSPPPLPPNWPAEGKIVIQGLGMRYRDGPLVLRDVSIVVTGGEKVGVAGRTGSGKSSLMVALFRIEELAAGSVFIDGVDISSVPLNSLRGVMGIIPQDPVMFSASVRFNLDPFNQHDDAAVWRALEDVEMKAHVETLPGKLSEEVAEGGDNFSAGQRQLICIARALLRKPKVLVLDEATASIDNDTDAMIQRMVRTAFKQCTVLTIAHRLHTIIDSDKILVLDQGNMVEFDSPEVLLNKEGGLFKALWDKHVTSHTSD